MHWIERLGPAPSTAQFGLFSAALAAAAALVLSFDFVPILDHINLAFHEFGHPLFGILGETMHWLGGTLAQFIFPIATTVHFLRREQLLSAAACAVWGAENLRYVAFYLGDARSMAIPLVGGGEHDWNTMLSWWGLLEKDTAIAGFLTFISWSGWVAVWLIVALRWRQGQADAQGEAERERRARIIREARERRPPGAAK